MKNMSEEFKKKAEQVLHKLPSPKVLVGLAIAIILSSILYLSILFLLSN
jgi:hypothetical protein